MGKAKSQQPKPWEQAKGAVEHSPDPLAEKFVASLSYDRRLYKQDIAGSIAHAQMLKKVDLISKNDLVAIEKGLKQIEREINETGIAWSGWKTELEDVHMCIETALIEKIGDAGRKLHTGRSRNDQVVLDVKMWIKDETIELHKKFNGLMQEFVTLAGRDGLIIMPSYTHLQRAQPIVVGAELMAWITAFDRAAQRFTVLSSIHCENPLGAGAIAGSSLPLNRDQTASALGVGPPTPSSIDSTANRDAAIDFVYALAMTAMTLSRWAEQWILYTTNEFGFITLDDRYTTGSSMMPQKRNPDMLELIRGRCGNLYGHLIGLLTICKGLPIGYHRDLQEDKSNIFSAYDTVSDSLAMATRIVSTVRFNPDRIAASLNRGFLDATSLAEYLVTQGSPFRTAHQIVGALVHRCETRGQEQLADLALSEINAACHEAGLGQDRCDNDVYNWLGSENVVKRYRTIGNAGRIGFEQQLAAWRTTFQKNDG